MADGIKQWGNLGGLVAGLFTEDYDLIGRSLIDHIVELVEQKAAELEAARAAELQAAE